MIPRFIHEQLIDDCDILVEMFKRYEKIKAKNNMEIKEEKETAYKETEGKLFYVINSKRKSHIRILQTYTITSKKIPFAELPTICKHNARFVSK